MEAATLKSKKCNKGKIKKNIKNVLCRPDPMYWPLLTEEEGKQLEIALTKLKIDIPVFQKLHWKELKSIPKDQRPKPPKLQKVDGLLFGFTECTNALCSDQCSAIIIEATVNPRMIVQPVIEACSLRKISVVCLSNLRQTSLANFGISTSCLGVKSDALSDLADLIAELAKSHAKPEKSNKTVEKMETEEITANTVTESKDTIIVKKDNVYLYRTSNKTRVFVPTTKGGDAKVPKIFHGQDFIGLPKDDENKTKGYMKMILKRISNNPDRVKKK